MSRSFSILILAGGRSRRMGSDKASLLFHGEPLLARAIRRLSVATDDLLVAVADPAAHAAIANAAVSAPDATITPDGSITKEVATASKAEMRFVTDLHPGAGPLAGLEAGLSAARHDLLLMVAVDMPFSSVAVARGMLRLANAYDVVLPFSVPPDAGDPRPEPLHALYRRTCLPMVTASLEAGERQVVSFFPQVRVRALPPASVLALDPSGLAFANANTPEDWARMLAIAEHD